MSHSNLFMQQIGGKITLFLLSFFFSSLMSNVQVIPAIDRLLDDEDEEKENVQERSQWVRPWIAKGKSDGAFYTIFQEDAEGFRGYIRLNTTSFENLFELLAPCLLKKDTVMRECIKPEEMCCVALKYFASGESFHSLEYEFRIIRKPISYIVEQVAATIIKTLAETYLKHQTLLMIGLKDRERLKNIVIFQMDWEV